MTTIKTVQGIYEAFGKGDAGAIVERVADDVAWEYGAIPNEVPWLRPGRGRDHVLRFLRTVAEELELRRFEILELVGNDRLVVAIARLEFVVKRTGRTLVEDAEPHLWHFDDRGRVVKFRHAADTYGHRVALGLA